LTTNRKTENYPIYGKKLKRWKNGKQN